MIIDRTIAFETIEENKRISQLYHELRQIEIEGIDEGTRQDWEGEWEEKQRELNGIFRSIENRYMESITPEIALMHGKDAINRLKPKDYEQDRKRFSIYAQTFEGLPEDNILVIRATEGPEGATAFISQEVRLQREKLVKVGDKALLDELEAAIADKVQAWFPGRSLPATTGLVAMPNSEALYFLTRMINGAKGGRTPRQSTTNRHEKLEIGVTNRDGKSVIRFIRTITKKGKTDSRVMVETSELVLKSNKGFLKIFYFILSELAKRDFPPELNIPIQWFVDVGMYSKASSAKRALMDFREQILDVRMMGEVKRGNVTIEAPGDVMIYHCNPKEKNLEIRTNPLFNWDFICGYFTVFPDFAFQLSENAFSMICYIFYLARQKRKEVSEDGLVFNISLGAIADYLGLPPVEAIKNRKYKDRIIRPILNTVEEIMQKAANDPTCREGAFVLAVHEPETTNIHEWLTGRLEIRLKPHFTKTFLEVAREADKKKAQYLKAKAEAVAKLEAKKEASGK